MRLNLGPVLLFIGAAALLTAAAPLMAQGILVTVDGQQVNFTRQQPMISGGTVLVPLRGVFEKLGAHVDYDGGLKRVTAVKGETTVVLVIGKDTAYVNGEPRGLLLPATVMNGSTMVPLRFVSEALGARVAWHSDSRAVEIVTAASGAGDLPQAPGTTVTGRVTGVFPQLNPPLITLMVNGENTQVPLASDVVVLVNMPDGRSIQAKLSDIQRGDQVNVKRSAGGEGVLIISSYGEKSGTVKSIRSLPNSNYQVTLDDGTIVEMVRDAPVTMAGRNVDMTDVQPGESVVIRTNPQTKTAYGMAVITGGEGMPTPPAAVKVTSFTVSPTGYLKLGSTITATLMGTPGGRATFEMPGVKGAERILMTEKPAGRYTGTFRIPAGVSVEGATVLGTLEVGGVTAPTIQAANTVTVDSTAPAVTGITPADNEVAFTQKPLIYATLSDPASGIGNVVVMLDGVDVTQESVVTPAFFNYRPADPLSVGTHTAAVRVIDKAGNVTERSVRFEVKKGSGLVKSITVTPEGPYRAGDTISVAAKAPSGGRVAFGIGTAVTGIAMKETSGGTYKGSYTVKTGDSVEKAPLVVAFKPKSGSEVTATAPNSVTISAGPPAVPEITAPIPGAAVDSPVVIAGKAAPNANVNVTVEYRGQLLVLPVQGTVASTEVKAGADGKWQTEPVTLSKPAGVSKVEYTATATVVDASGQKSEQAGVDFKRK